MSMSPTNGPTTDPIARLELEGITKRYPGVVANQGVSLRVMPGQIHAVLGENGAGKSTLMKIIYGVVKPDAGEIRWQGEGVAVTNPARARELGIGMVFQHFSLFETLTVVENVALALPGRWKSGAPSRALSQRISEVAERYGLPVDPRRLVHSLSVGERQSVEIIRCLLVDPMLLILDEPTSVLTPQAIPRLFETLRQLASEGRSILYISHKLDEIRQLCTHATVLRDGRVTGNCDPRQETAESLARMMIGRDLPHPQHGESRTGEVRLELTEVSCAPEDPFGTPLRNLNLQVRSGEIVGIAGVSGNGQQELLAVISGERSLAERGAMTICGAAAGRMGPGERRALGLCFVPEDRLGRGAVPRMTLAENGLLTAHRQGQVKHGLIEFRAVEEFARRCIAEFQVRGGGPQTEARALSGGNLQKFIVGREISQKPRLLVVAQPTWGVDVGAAAFLRQRLIDLRNDGVAILVLSEELDELFEVADRICVIAQGRLSPLRPIQQTSVEEIGLWMSGLWPGGDEASRSPVRKEAQRAPAT